MAFIDYHDGRPHDHVLRISTVHERAMLDHIRFYRTLVHGPSPLSRVRREMIGVAVSQLNGCHY